MFNYKVVQTTLIFEPELEKFQAIKTPVLVPTMSYYNSIVLRTNIVSWPKILIHKETAKRRIRKGEDTLLTTISNNGSHLKCLTVLPTGHIHPRDMARKLADPRGRVRNSKQLFN